MKNIILITLSLFVIKKILLGTIHIKKNLINSSSNVFVVLIDPFPNHETDMVAQDQASPSQTMMLSSTKHKDNAMVAIRNKYYGNLNPSSGKANHQPSISTQYTLDPPLGVIPIELTIKPPKRFIHKSTFNPRAIAA